MPKLKVPRKSTAVDMTAMCDVAFLLLSFFILTTHSKPDEVLQVTTPKSVSTIQAEQKKTVMITMDKRGAVYLTVSDDANEQKQAIIDDVDKTKGLNLTAGEKKAWMRSGSFIGVPFSQLKSYLDQPAEMSGKIQLPGIPVTDTLNNELAVWMASAKKAFAGTKMALLVKGDAQAKYPAFKGITDAFKKVDELKFQMITDQEGVPPGTDLFKKISGK